MLILSLDTSAITSAAVISSKNGFPTEVLSECVSYDTRHHAENLSNMIFKSIIKANISIKDITSITVGVGPGPFTGLRSGITTAKTLSFVLNVPVYGVCSLDSLAYSSHKYIKEAKVLVASDARRKEVYWAEYTRIVLPDGRINYISDTGPRVSRSEDIVSASVLPSFGFGALLYPENFIYKICESEKESYPKAGGLGILFANRTQNNIATNLDTTPLYLRKPDAKIPVKKKSVL